MSSNRIVYILLVILVAFLALTTVAGGIGLLTGAIAPGLELLQGSPFSSYTIPGLALAIIVGGSALIATILLVRRHRWGALACGVTGIGIVIFEIVEVLSIGSDPGVARNLQIFLLHRWPADCSAGCYAVGGRTTFDV
jgi:hypothetical protein